MPDNRPAEMRPPPRRPRFELPRLLVVIPAQDEETTIDRVVEGIPTSLPGVAEIETLVVDDGSTDATAQRARAAGATVLLHRSHQGLGSAFHSALQHMIAGGFDVLVSIDADGQFDPLDIAVVTAPVIAGEADFATGSRFKDPRLAPEMPFLRRWGNRAMSLLISRLSGVPLHDVSCGMRCYNRVAALHLHLLGRFTYTQEVILNLAFKGLSIVEVPISVRGTREVGKSRVARSLWSYAWHSSKIILRAYRDYRPMRFFGGLACALLVPSIALAAWLVVVFLRTGAFSPHKWAGFCSLALLMLALAFSLAGLIGDMLNRQRIYLEEILFRQRNQAGHELWLGRTSLKLANERQSHAEDSDQQQHLPPVSR